MRFQAGIQILLIIVSVIIVMAVLKPEFAEIQDKQDQLAELNGAITKADTYNRALSEKINRKENFPTADLVALDRFLPNEVNPVRVARDITTIVESNGLLLQDVVPGESSVVNVDSAQVAAGSSEVPGVVIQGGGSLQSELRREMESQLFEFEAIGTYDKLKDTLAAIERNAYPLRIVSIEFANETDESATLFVYRVVLQAFALNSN